MDLVSDSDVQRRGRNDLSKVVEPSSFISYYQLIRAVVVSTPIIGSTHHYSQGPGDLLRDGRQRHAKGKPAL